jgi:hypothetical protein
MQDRMGRGGQDVGGEGRMEKCLSCDIVIHLNTSIFLGTESLCSITSHSTRWSICKDEYGPG